jgi:hypothetical protein
VFKAIESIDFFGEYMGKNKINIITKILSFLVIAISILSMNYFHLDTTQTILIMIVLATFAVLMIRFIKKD